MAFIDMDEAFRQVFTQNTVRGDAKQVSMDEAFAAVFGEARREEMPRLRDGAAAIPLRDPEMWRQAYLRQESENVTVPPAPPSLNEVLERGKTLAATDYHSDNSPARSLAYALLSGAQGGAGRVSDALSAAVHNVGSTSRMLDEAMAEYGFAPADLSAGASDALDKLGRHFAGTAEALMREGTRGEAPGLFEQVPATLVSILTQALLAGAMSRIAAPASVVGSASAYGGSSGLIDALAEGQNIKRSLIDQGVKPQTADETARVATLSQFPINAATDTLGGLIAGQGGNILRGIFGRGLAEFLQEPTQQVLADAAGKPGPDGQPFGWADLARRFPEMATAWPQAARDVGPTAAIAGGIFGGMNAAGRQAAGVDVTPPVQQRSPRESAADFVARSGVDLRDPKNRVLVDLIYSSPEFQSQLFGDWFTPERRAEYAKAQEAGARPGDFYHATAQNGTEAEAPKTQTEPVRGDNEARASAERLALRMVEQEMEVRARTDAAQQLNALRTAQEYAAWLKENGGIARSAETSPPGTEFRDGAVGGIPTLEITALSSSALPDVIKDNQSAGGFLPQGTRYDESISPAANRDNEVVSKPGMKKIGGSSIIESLRNAPINSDELADLNGAMLDSLPIGIDSPESALTLREAAAERGMTPDQLLGALVAEKEETDHGLALLEEHLAVKSDAQRRRRDVFASIRKEGGINYSFVRDSLGKEEADQLRRTVGPGLFSRKGAGLDKLAQVLSATGHPFGGDRELYAFLMARSDEAAKLATEPHSPEAAFAPSASPSRSAADEITAMISRGERIPNNRALFDITDRAFGGTQAEGRYTAKDAYDAMELGVNLYLREKGYHALGMKGVNDAKKALKTIEAEILEKLPTQANRTAEQVEFQQFSTPPNLAFAANWLLNAGPQDVVLEPSAGIGGLAVFAKNAGAKVIVNELSQRRADILREMGFDEVYTENAEQIHNILPDSVRPTKVVMNPPFSATAGRVEGQRRTKNATLHVEQALRRLEPGGRAVMILGKGMADDSKAFKPWWDKIKSEYNVLGNVEISGKEYAKYGTSFGNILAVVDKTGPTAEGTTITGKFDTIAEAINALAPVRNQIGVRTGPYGSIQELLNMMRNKIAGSLFNRMYVDYGRVSEADAEAIKKAIGIDVSGYTMRLDGKGIAHALKEHGPGSPKLAQFPNSVPLTANDFLLLPKIAKNPDKTMPGGDRTGPNDELRFVVKKQIGDAAYTAVQQVHPKERVLMVTLWKERAGTSPPTPKARPVQNGTSDLPALKRQHPTLTSEAVSDVRGQRADAPPSTLPSANVPKIGDEPGGKTSGFESSGRIPGAQEVKPRNSMESVAPEAQAGKDKTGNLQNNQTNEIETGQKTAEDAPDDADGQLRTITIEENVRRGQAAMKQVIRDHSNVRNAMYREDIGGISFVWGHAETTTENGKKKRPHGIAHIIEKHGMDAAQKMVDVLANGKVTAHYGKGTKHERLDITYDGYEAHLALYKDENRETWLITGYEKNKPSGATGERSDSSGATLSETTSPRRREGAEGVDQNIPSAARKVNRKPTELAEVAQNVVEVTQKTREERAAERAGKAAAPEDDNAVYDDYTPAKLKIAGAKPHPADLVQSAAMAAVEPPNPTYKPKLPKKMIESGALSEAQLEAVVYAGQSFEQHNQDGTRRGFMIGDGTGVGKGREISGIITDQLAQGHGKGKAVWVSMNVGLLKDAKRDWEGVGNNPDDIFSQKDSTKTHDKIAQKDGIAFTAYSTLRGKDRLEQLKAWLGPGFDGVIALDEAHNANNALETKAERGVRNVSQQAMAVQDLVNAFPEARVLYVSATGATEVRNLAMLDRLGLWGKGTPFPSKTAFVSEIEKGGMAAMELVARDMKAMGLYVARSLSYRAGKNGGPENVTFRRLEHPLTDHQKIVYNRIAEAWQVVLNNIDKALELIVGADAKKKSANVRGRALGQFWSAHQRAFNQIITSMQTPSVVKAIQNDLADGKSIVIQLTNTNEADQKRALSRLEEGDTLDDLDITPRDALLNFLKNSFPVIQYQEVMDENGNVRLMPVQDSRGNPVENRDAVALRDEMMRDVASIAFPDSPIDMILNAFGADNVAEITGRGERIVIRDGKRVREKRPVLAREADKLAFQDGRKRILVFSEAGGTGASYHADLAAANQQKREHYLLQPGWRADAAIQGLGRTHRSNEAHKPEYVLVTTDLPGQRRFISTIARRLEQLGALTTGERKSATQGLFSERDNLESPHAQIALMRMFDQMSRYGVGDIPANEILSQLGFSNVVDGDTGCLKPDAIPKIPQFLNRLLSLKHDAQQLVFEEFGQELDAEIRNAIARGELDVGTETLQADVIDVLQETVVYRDVDRSIETKYVQLETLHKQRPTPFGSVRGSDFYISKKTGGIVAAREAKATVTNAETGEIERQYALTAIDPRYRGRTTEKALLNETYYASLAADRAKELWSEQAQAFPEYRKEQQHLITGVVLPIWDRLTGHPRIKRVVTRDGQTFLGRLIEPKDLMNTLRALGAEYNGKKITAEDIFSALSKTGSTAELANGWRLKEVRVNGEKRVELIGPDFTQRNRLRGMGLIAETISWKERWFVPVADKGKMDEVLDISPVVEIRGGDVFGEAAETVNADKADFDINDYGGMSVKFVDGTGAGNPFVQRTEQPATTPFRFEDAETEARYQASRAGVQRISALKHMGEAMRSIVQGFKSDFPAIADEKFDFAREELRKLNRKWGVAVHEALTTLRKTVKDMTPDEYDLFSRKRILDDLTFQKNDMPDSALPYGFTDERLEREHKRITEEAGKNKKIRDAVEWEERVGREINKRMILEAEEIGWYSLADKFHNPHYFRHVVLDFANAAADGRKVGLHAPDRRGYLKKRHGSERDISAHYIQAMGEVRALQLRDLETIRTLKNLRAEYDIAEQLKRQAFERNEAKYFSALIDVAESQGLKGDKAADWAGRQVGQLNKRQAMSMSRLFSLAKRGELPEGKFGRLVKEMAEASAYEDLTDAGRKRLNRYMSWLAGMKDEKGTMEARTYFKYAARKKQEIKDTLGKDFVEWRDLLPEGYVEWHPFQNRLVFSVSTVAENLVNQALDAGLTELSIPLDALEKMRVLGGHRQTWAVPAELAETLNKLGTPVERTALGEIAKGLTTQWKEWVLHAPMRVFKYNVRNVTGDADAVLAGNPDTLRLVPRAFQELANVYLKGQTATGELAEFTKRGGAEGAMHTQELGDRTTISEFKAVLAQGEKGVMRMPKKVWRVYWNGARSVSDFRENVLRYAAYLSYLEQIEKSDDGRPKNWGASKRSEVMANRDNRDKAFKLANELLGAYDQVSETGQWLRDIALPFYSWMEVNARRYLQIFRNGIEDGEIGAVTKRVLLGQAMKAPVYTWRLGKTLFKVSLLWMLAQVFNRMIMRDEDDELTPDVRARPHITLGRDVDGRVIYFDRLGAFADLLDWFSLDSAWPEIRDILNGYQSPGDYAKKMAQAPVSKLINAMNPLIKTPLEVVSGQQYFPDAFNPRSIRDLGMYVAETVGLSPEFVALTGRPSAGYANTRLRNMFAYSADPDEAAYWWLIDKKRQFEENVLGTSWSGAGATSPRGMALQNIKRSIRYGDNVALKKYLHEYAAYDGTATGLTRSIESMKPLSGLSEVNRLKFVAWLSAEDRRYLPRAEQYFRSLFTTSK